MSFIKKTIKFRPVYIFQKAVLIDTQIQIKKWWGWQTLRENIPCKDGGDYSQSISVTDLNSEERHLRIKYQFITDEMDEDEIILAEYSGILVHYPY